MEVKNDDNSGVNRMSYMKWAYKDGILSHEDGSSCVIGQSVVIDDELITRLIADFTESDESNARQRVMINHLTEGLGRMQVRELRQQITQEVE